MKHDTKNVEKDNLKNNLGAHWAYKIKKYCEKVEIKKHTLLCVPMCPKPGFGAGLGSWVTRLHNFLLYFFHVHTFTIKCPKCPKGTLSKNCSIFITKSAPDLHFTEGL